jgi:hypothetical protein
MNPAESSATGSGHVALHFRTFPVRDAGGHEITLYEMRDTAALFGLAGRLRIELPSGEQVEQLDEDTFLSADHHKILKRIH